MKLRKNEGLSRQGGFTLLELLLVLAILSIMIAAVFSQLNSAQQRLSTEETKLDDFQQARDFVDQFFRDINQIGTPNVNMFDTTQAFSPVLTTPASYSYMHPYANDSRFAIGLVSVGASSVKFEGSMNGNGTVQSVTYQIDGNGNCSLCMQRSQVDKASGNPLTQNTPNWGTEVNDVIIDVNKPIFRYFEYDGTEITGTHDISVSSNDAAILAKIKTIQINLTIRNPQVMDQKTHQPIETNFEGEVSVNNCSMAKNGENMSCQ
jgi:prepilin-type N-terminal cleavage/methylation domain-containing protein